LNSKGGLIGVNTAIFSPSGAYSGIGFSIPVNEVKYVVPDLIQYGVLKRPIMGIQLVPDQYVDDGVMIKHVSQNGPAQRVGLKGIQRDRAGNIIAGDIIVGIDGVRIRDTNDLLSQLDNYVPGDRIEIVFKRSEKPLSVELVLGSTTDR